MSIKVMTYVWESSQHKGSDLLTMLAIADYAHDDGTNAYPSIATLARKTRMTERNVQLVLAELEASGELRISRNAGPSGTHVFTIPLPPAEGAKSFQGGEKKGGGWLKQASPNPLRDPSEEDPYNPPLIPPEGGGRTLSGKVQRMQDAQVVLEHLNTVTGHHYAQTRTIAACLRRGATIAQCCLVIDWWQAVWLQQHPTLAPHFNNETVFRLEKFDKYRAAAEAWEASGRCAPASSNPYDPANWNLTTREVAQ